MAESPQKQTLEALLSRAAEGDESAWRQIVDTYSGRVYGLVRAQCGNADLAEEITQSTFCTIVAKMNAYTELGRFESWIFRIAMNRLRDEMRRRKRHAAPTETSTLAGLVASEASGPAAGGSARAEIERLRAAVSQLSDADQRIIHLRHFGRLSFKQIAEVLGQPLGTVLARQHRALKKLRELMGGEEA